MWSRLMFFPGSQQAVTQSHMVLICPVFYVIIYFVIYQGQFHSDYVIMGNSHIYLTETTMVDLMSCLFATLSMLMESHLLQCSQ